MDERSTAGDWLAGFIVRDPPRGEAALALSRALVDALGSPQLHAPAVHIVGTAGKGSVAARLTARLVAAGVGVATHQSPHVYDVRERFLVDGALPTWAEVEAAIGEVEVAVEQVRGVHGRSPSFFAVTAAMSWVLGRRNDADVFVTEAGIGGRLDATAVLDRPDTITVVTTIGLDHTEVLGTAIEEVAREKASVMIGRRDVVLGAQLYAPAVRTVRELATEHGVRLHESDQMPADWRVDAAATVECVAGLLEPIVGVALPDVDAPWPPGRYEVVHVAARRVVFDGAHNVDKLGALGAVIRGDVRPALVIAALGEKKDLSRSSIPIRYMADLVLATTFRPDGGVGPRGRPARELADAVIAAGGRAEECESVVDAVHRAIQLTGPGDTIVVTGSFLILAEARAAFASHRLDH